MPHSARFLAGAADPNALPQWPYPEVAFAGRSNVGKSSLLNGLVGQRHLARVSKTPGRTQQINFFLIDERMTFVDFPGYGFARVPLVVKQQWKRLVEGYLLQRTNLRVVVVIVDLRRGIGDDDRLLLDFLQANRIAAIVVATKADKVGYGERQRRAAAITSSLDGNTAVIVCSAGNGEGVRQVWKAIENLSRAAGR